MREEQIDDAVTITWRDERQGRSVIQNAAELQALLRHFGIESAGGIESEEAVQSSAEEEHTETGANSEDVIGGGLADPLADSQDEPTGEPPQDLPDESGPPPLRARYDLMKRPEHPTSEQDASPQGFASGPTGESTATNVTYQFSTESVPESNYETEQYTIRILRDTDPQTVLITRKPVDAVQEAAWRFAEERMARIVRQDDELGVLFLDENVFVPFSKLAYDPQRGFQLL